MPTATYYVDLATVAEWNTRAGTSAGACWYGITGLQNAFDRAVAGDTVYIMGTGALNKNYTIAYDANSGNLTDGEEVTWGSEATHGHGIVHFLGAMATPVQIEVISGANPANDVTITGVTSTNTITPSAGPVAATIDVDTNAGTNAAGYIKYIGCGAAFAVDGTRSIINAATVVIYVLTIAAAAKYLWWENIEVKNAGSARSGFYFSATANTGHIFINCCANGCGGTGFSAGTYLTYSTFIRCVSYGNTSNGFSVTGLGNNWLFCCARENGAFGWASPQGVLYNCVSHANTTQGIDTLYPGLLILNCVIDSNSGNGLTSVAFTNLWSPVLIGNRITNHAVGGKVGFNLSGKPAVTGWNYFENNDGDNIQSTTMTLHYPIPLENTATTSNINETADNVTDTNQGYVSVAGHNFSTGYTDSTDPNIRRTAITIPWS